jgi:outer membrane protein assembly factor BamD
MRKLALALSILMLLAAAGCGGDKGINETGYSDEPLVDREGNKLDSADAQRLYESAREFLVDEDPQRALRLYAEVQARFPFSPYAAQSEMESVAAHYQAQQYEAAVSAADRFIKQRPRNEHIDYVYYLRGLSNYDRNEAGLLGGDPDKRDTRFLEQAFTDFNLLVENYPQSVYRKDAQLHMVDIRNRLAEFQIGVAEYYLRRRAYVAASRRAETIIQRYQGSDSVPRALEIMEESYARLGLADLSEDARAILQASYPNYILHRDEFYRQRAGEEPRYALPAMDAPASEGKAIEPSSQEEADEQTQ